MAEPIRILIADDEINNRLLMRKLLSPLGRCDLVVDGEEACEAFELAVAEGEPYDLVCLDFNMPNRDGDQALKEMRLLEGRIGVPGKYAAVVFMVTGEEKSGRAPGSGPVDGSDDHLVKPVDREELYKKLWQHGFDTGGGKAAPPRTPPPPMRPVFR